MSLCVWWAAESSYIRGNMIKKLLEEAQSLLQMSVLVKPTSVV